MASSNSTAAFNLDDITRELEAAYAKRGRVLKEWKKASRAVKEAATNKEKLDKELKSSYREIETLKKAKAAAEMAT